VEKSGWVENDYIEEASKLFASENGDKFTLMTVWQYMRKHVPKFEDVVLCTIVSGTSTKKRYHTGSSIDEG